MRRIQYLQDNQRKWSDNTFADGKFSNSRSLPISKHLTRESRELTEALEKYINDPSDETLSAVRDELADVSLLLLDCSAHVGFSVQSLFLMSLDKFEVNKKRKWGLPDHDGVIEHID